MNLIALRLSVSACHLARAGDGYLLVDFGYEADWEVFQQRLREARDPPCPTFTRSSSRTMTTTIAAF